MAAKQAPIRVGPTIPEQLAFAEKTSVAGLTDKEATAYHHKPDGGFNELPDKKKNKILMFLSYLWGPMPIAIWVAVIIEVIRAAIAQEDYEGFIVLLILQFANAIVGFIEESKAGDAIAALRSQLAPKCHVLRDGKWQDRMARELVPGDIAQLKIGDIIPADGILLEGPAIQADQAALTGESLPATIYPWGHVKMGSGVKAGEINFVVTATGKNTFFGSAANLISSVSELGHLQKVLLHITTWLLLISLTLCVIIFAVLMTTPDPSGYHPGSQSKVIRCLSVTIVILVASIPIAIEVVCTSTMAVGSHIMAHKKVIVAKLYAIEELAGMTILCSDKTGTLTKNQLAMRRPIITAPWCTAEDVMFYSTLASKREMTNQDAMDFCITRAFLPPNSDEPEQSKASKADTPHFLYPEYVEKKFVPFNPTDKRTVATVEGPVRPGMPQDRIHYVDAAKGTIRFRVAKGAPQAVIRICENAVPGEPDSELKSTVMAATQELADRGFRALGVAILFDDVDDIPPPTAAEIAAEKAAAEKRQAEAIAARQAGTHSAQTAYKAPPIPVVGQGRWIYIGTLSLFDPPRDDTKATIAAAIANGIEVKMITGDHAMIAKETCRQLGMGSNILKSDVLTDPNQPAAVLDKIILEAHGFAEVLPEHKFLIVEHIRNMGHVTGMTGDGVNDAPALKRADIGIAVHGATDAARAAADIVLTEEGLSVIIDAIFESRKIFQRMRNYIIYRIACTFQLLLFFWLAIIAVSPDGSFMYNSHYHQPGIANTSGDDDIYNHQPSFTLPIIALVIITILNDGCMITIAYDNVVPEVKPQKWDLTEVWFVAISLGLVACLSSMILLTYVMHANVFNPGGWANIWASDGRDYMLFSELRTIMYLKISISDFLTLFSARTRRPFWERGLGRALGIAACFALTCSTIFALFWGDFIIVKSDPMASLRRSKGAILGTWMYCLLWWVVQDCVKVGVYWVIDNVLKSEDQKNIENFARNHSLEYLPPAKGGAAHVEMPLGAEGVAIEGVAAAPITPHHALATDLMASEGGKPRLPNGTDLGAVAAAAAEQHAASAH